MRVKAGIRPLFALVVLHCVFGESHSQYLGKLIGKLSELHHGVSGEVYAVDGRTLHIKDFTYDGQGPAAYFYAGNTRVAGTSGFRLKDENGSGKVIRRYRKEGVTITLPEGKNLNNIKIFYLWCEEFAVNFGDVKIPRNFDYPRPQKIASLQGVHGVSSDNIVIVDAQTLLIPNLSYDGEAPDAKFWVGRGPKPSPQGIRVPDENGKEVPLKRYDKKTVVLTLPGDLTAFDIGHFGIWCEAFTVDFGHIQIPQNLNLPPSLKMLGISPQSKLNCEVLYDDLAFEARWAVAGDSIVLQLVAKLGDREYMSFGLSGEDTHSAMVKGDVVVASIDKESGKGSIDDYYLDAKSQCSGPTGSCPDIRFSDNTNNVKLLNAAMVNGYSIVTYQRPLKASDAFDRPILTNQSQAIIWAIGPLNQREEVSFHSHYLKQDKFIEFGRTPKWNCPMPETEQPNMHAIPSSKEVTEETPTTVTFRAKASERRRGGHRTSPRPEVSSDSEKSPTRTKPHTHRIRGGGRSTTSTTVAPIPTPAAASKRDAWVIPPIKCDEPEDGVFYAQMGPTGGKRGYPAITGHVGWGISWYINGLLIPEINVVRGKTYTFVVEGGFNPEIPAKYHPFYISDDEIGGYEHKTPEERKNVQIFAGATQSEDGTIQPTGTGRLCHWTYKGDLDADDYESFGAYQRSLELKCDQGEPGVIQWTPDKDTPDTVYYQCFTHRYLGWKINVHDKCDELSSAASEIKPVVIEALQQKVEVSKQIEEDDLEKSPSLREETMVNPNNILSQQHEDKFVSTVSAMSTTTSTTTSTTEFQPIADPDQTDNGQLYQQPNKHFYHSEPQQFYFSRPSFYMNPPNPYNMFPQSSIHQNPLSLPLNFRPSLPLDQGTETTANSKTSTTDRPITTTVIHKDRLETSPSNIQNQTTYFNKINIKIPTVTVSKPSKHHISSNFPKMTYPHSRPMTMFRPPHSQFPRQTSPYFKKIVYRTPLRKPHPSKQHMAMPMFFKPKHKPPTKFTLNQMKPPGVLVISPQVITKTPSILSYPRKIEQTTQIVKNVEISPLQASTEKEPEIQTAKSIFEETNEHIPIVPSQLIMVENKPVVPSFKHKGRIVPAESAGIPPAVNTGFHPGTVKIERGFKPIINRRMSDSDSPETTFDGEIGVIQVDGDLPHKVNPFEPMFVPSPTVLKVPNKSLPKKLYPKKHGLKITLKYARDLGHELEDSVAESSRSTSYYLPPDDQKQSPITTFLRQPLQAINHDLPKSSTDSEIAPPDVVVTFDGKKVSGASLTSKLSDYLPSVLEHRQSKSSDVVKTRPQFVPFRGDLPPLNTDYNTADMVQISHHQQGFLNRELETPLPETGGDAHKVTRLRLVNLGSNEGHLNQRKKRAAHHTEEHTRQQKEEMLKSAGTLTSISNSLRPYSIVVILSLVILQFVNK